MKDGKYKTANGSTMLISRGGTRVEVDFYYQEEGACIKCRPGSLNDDGCMIWACNHCGGGYAKLESVVDTQVNPQGCNISLPKITPEMVEDYYPWLIYDDPIYGHDWNKAAVDFTCLLKSECCGKG